MATLRPRILAPFLLVLTGGADAARTGAPGPEVDARMWTLAEEGVARYHDDDYDGARKRFAEMTRLDPDSPAGHVMLVATCWGMMSDHRTLRFGPELERHAARAIELAQARIDAGTSLARSYQYLGGAYGYRGLYAALKGSWVAAFRDAWRAAEALEKAQELRPDLADTDHGLGLYLYWRAQKASVLTWLPLVEDTRAEGIRRLRRATREGELSRDVARAALMGIYFQEERYDDVLAVAAELRGSHPAAIAPAWWTGAALVRKRRWQEARETYRDVLRRLARRSLASKEAKLEARFFIALSDLNLGETQAAVDGLRAVAKEEGRVDADLWGGRDLTEEAGELLEERGVSVAR